jgi:hypothetical protein
VRSVPDIPIAVESITSIMSQVDPTPAAQTLKSVSRPTSLSADSSNQAAWHGTLRRALRLDGASTPSRRDGRELVHERLARRAGKIAPAGGPHVAIAARVWQRRRGRPIVGQTAAKGQPRYRAKRESPREEK